MFNLLRRNKYQNSVIIPEYEPPESITAAELGLLFDGKAGRLELLAAIYQLKTKKIIAISRPSTGDTVLTLLSYQPTTLKTFEDLLIRFLFHESSEVYLSMITNGNDYVAMQSYFQYLLLQSLRDNNFIVLDNQLYDLSYDKYLTAISSDPILFAKEIYRGSTQRKLTERAEKLMPAFLGFKLYIETAELDKIKFHARGNLQEYIELLTPYAIALNQLERWEIIGIPLIIKLDAPAHQDSKESDNELGDFYVNLAQTVNRIDSYKVFNT